MQAADMSGDGRTDVVISAVRMVPVGPRGGFSRTDYLNVLLASADGSGSFEQTHSSQISASNIHVADFNNDGRKDVLTIATSTRSTSNLRLGNGNGTLGSGLSVTQFVGVQVTVADLNGDGKADVIRQNDGGSTSTVFLGKGNGKFTKGQTVAVTAEAIVADVDRDGRMDLVAANPASGVRALLGKGDGKFQPPQNFPGATNPTDIALADFDGDGWIDVALITILADNQERTSILLNDRHW
jgi:hypothetical protein